MFFNAPCYRRAAHALGPHFFTDHEAMPAHQAGAYTTSPKRSQSRQDLSLAITGVTKRFCPADIAHKKDDALNEGVVLFNMDTTQEPFSPGAAV